MTLFQSLLLVSVRKAQEETKQQNQAEFDAFKAEHGL
jgi:hypothetical protein